jgi:hypothetical protein
MTNQNNNEEWNENIVNSQDMVCFSSGDASYCIPKRLVSFIEKKAEQRGKREEQDRIFEEGWKMMEYNHKSENQWDGLVCANIRINTIQMLLDRVREPLNCSQSKNNQLK